MSWNYLSRLPGVFQQVVLVDGLDHCVQKYDLTCKERTTLVYFSFFAPYASCRLKRLTRVPAPGVEDPVALLWPEVIDVVVAAGQHLLAEGNHVGRSVLLKRQDIFHESAIKMRK